MRAAARIGMFTAGIGFEVGFVECRLGAGQIDCSMEVGYKMAVGFGVGFGDFGQCMWVVPPVGMVVAWKRGQIIGYGWWWITSEGWHRKVVSDRR